MVSRKLFAVEPQIRMIASYKRSSRLSHHKHD